MEIIKQLKITKEKTLPLFDLPESELIKTYAPGKWNVKQLLHHLADAETVLYDRIRRGIAKPKQVVWGFDQDVWCEKLSYNQLPLSLNKNVYTSVRAAIIHLAQNYYETAGHHQYVHNETGLRTVKDEFDKVALHNEHHLNQIVTALNQNYS